MFGARLTEDQQMKELPVPDSFRTIVDDRDHRLAAFRSLVGRFYQGIKKGTSLAPSFYDGYRCQQVIDAVYNSSESGRWIEIR